MVDKTRKPRMGLLLIGACRFKTLGEGTARGSYLARKEKEASWMAGQAGAIAEVVFPGVVYTSEDMQTAIDLFYNKKVDYVLATYLSWADDFAWNRFLRDMPPVPVLFAHRMRDSIELGDTHDDDEFTEYLSCGGLVGMQEASGNNARYNRPMMETAIGTWKQILERAGTFGTAARARALMRQSKAGLLACYNEAMWSTYVDPYNLFSKAGPEIKFLSVAELSDRVEQVPREEALKTMRELSERYEVLQDVEEDKFIASVRASIAMEEMAEAYDLDLLVLNDIDTVLFSKIGLRPGFYPTPGHGKTVIVPEGDLGGGLATYILQLLTGAHVNFIEPFHIDLPNDNFAAGHAGPNDYTDPNGKCKVSRDVRFAKTKYRYAGAPFAWYVFPEGEKTMLHCSEHNGRFLLAASQIECLPCEHFLATYSHSLFRAVGQTNRELFGKLLKIGVTQHYGIAPGNCQEAVKDLAMMLDFDFYQV